MSKLMVQAPRYQFYFEMVENVFYINKHEMLTPFFRTSLCLVEPIDPTGRIGRQILHIGKKYPKISTHLANWPIILSPSITIGNRKEKITNNRFSIPIVILIEIFISKSSTKALRQWCQFFNYPKRGFRQIQPITFNQSPLQYKILSNKLLNIPGHRIKISSKLLLKT